MLDTRRILVRYVVRFLYVLNVTAQAFAVKFSVRDQCFVSWACLPFGMLSVWSVGCAALEIRFVWDRLVSNSCHCRVAMHGIATIRRSNDQFEDGFTVSAIRALQTMQRALESSEQSPCYRERVRPVTLF